MLGRFGSDARVLVALLRGQSKRGTQGQRLERFYAPQAERYDSFRERLLRGRQELIDQLRVPPGGHLVELGGGTGHNLGYFGQRLACVGRIDIVDLCPSLLVVARRRAAQRPNVHVVEADACTWQPEHPVDCVYFAYSLSMIPDWRAAIDNALAMLKPGGTLGVVDFYVSEPAPPAGLARHSRLTRTLWPRWFKHDGVSLCPNRLRLLRERLPRHRLQEHRAPVPYLAGLRVPYYVLIGEKPDPAPIIAPALGRGAPALEDPGEAPILSARG